LNGVELEDMLGFRVLLAGVRQQQGLACGRAMSSSSSWVLGLLVVQQHRLKDQVLL
jgi:hypothetical protein